MYPFMVFTKLSVILMLCISGVFIMSRGFGMPIPYLEYGALEAWNIAAGAVLLAAGVAFGFFWKVGRRDIQLENQGESHEGRWTQHSSTITHGFKGPSLH